MAIDWNALLQGGLSAAEAYFERGASTPSPGYYPGATGPGWPTPEAGYGGNWFGDAGGTTYPDDSSVMGDVKRGLEELIGGGMTGDEVACIRPIVTAPGTRLPNLVGPIAKPNGNGQRYYVGADVTSRDVKAIIKRKVNARGRRRCNPR